LACSVLNTPTFLDCVSRSPGWSKQRSWSETRHSLRGSQRDTRLESPVKGNKACRPANRAAQERFNLARIFRGVALQSGPPAWLLTRCRAMSSCGVASSWCDFRPCLTSSTLPQFFWVLLLSLYIRLAPQSTSGYEARPGQGTRYALRSHSSDAIPTWALNALCRRSGCSTPASPTRSWSSRRCQATPAAPPRGARCAALPARSERPHPRHCTRSHPPLPPHAPRAVCREALRVPTPRGV